MPTEEAAPKLFNQFHVSVVLSKKEETPQGNDDTHKNGKNDSHTQIIHPYLGNRTGRSARVPGSVDAPGRPRCHRATWRIPRPARVPESPTKKSQLPSTDVMSTFNVRLQSTSKTPNTRTEGGTISTWFEDPCNVLCKVKWYLGSFGHGR
jgi:hypothetical protein